MKKRLGTRLGAAAIALLAVAVSSVVAYAGRSSPEVQLAVGTCAFPGTLTAQFTPAVHATPASVRVTLNGNGTCAGIGGLDTLTVALGGPLLLSCEGGEGALTGNLTFASGLLPPLQTTAVYIGGPGSLQLIITGLNFAAVGTFAWSPTATALCAASGTGSTSLTGSLSFVNY